MKVETKPAENYKEEAIVVKPKSFVPEPDSDSSDGEEGKESDSDSDSDEQATCGVSEIDELFKEFTKHINITDFRSILVDFDQLVALIARHRSTLFASSRELPPQILDLLKSIQETVDEVTPAIKKKMKEPMLDAYS